MTVTCRGLQNHPGPSGYQHSILQRLYWSPGRGDEPLAGDCRGRQAQSARFLPPPDISLSPTEPTSAPPGVVLSFIQCRESQSSGMDPFSHGLLSPQKQTSVHTLENLPVGAGMAMVTERCSWAQGHAVLFQCHGASCSFSKTCAYAVGKCPNLLHNLEKLRQTTLKEAALSGYSSPSLCRQSPGCDQMSMLKCCLQRLLTLPLSREGPQSLALRCILCKPLRD